MITDIEMNGTYRGAVEVYNLCRHLKMNDVLFAECTRTFGTHTLDGRSWLYRLSVECGSIDRSGTEHAAASWECLIPKTKKPQVRNDRIKPNDVDAYGLRPLTQPWLLLSPHEFYRHWHVVPLLSPSEYERRKVYRRTTWVEGCDTEARVSGRTAAKPGVHYVVRPCDFDEDYYYTYPHEPVDIYSIFRHAWVLERRRRPIVVCIEGVQVPKANKSAVENSKYCSIFFDPTVIVSRAFAMAPLLGSVETALASRADL